jgi:branched-chain amino acid transport system ATP-binding protein
MTLEIENLTKRFGEFVAVDSVSFPVADGVLKSIIGPNGAGKTTLFNLLSGGLTPNTGTIRFNGEDVTGLPPEKLNGRGISRSFQITNVFSGVTVRENIQVAAQARMLDRPWNFYTPRNEFEDVLENTEQVLERVGLKDQADWAASELAHGGKRRLEIGIALATAPEILLLDEPTAGMSPEETEDTIALVRDLSEDHTILLIEHDMDVVEEVSDEILVLHRGQKLAEGTPTEVMTDEKVQQAYLGVE